MAADPNGRVNVIVELSGDPTTVVQAKQGRKLTGQERADIKGSLKKQQDAITGAIKGKGGKIVAQMQSAYNGIQVSIPADAVDAVAALPNVVAIHAARTYTIDNAVSVPFLGVPQVWQSTGFTGKNVKVGIIDTGIDYTHANFGGPGTVAAYDAALKTDTQPADPALFGPGAPRIKGGWDLVGDDYNADPSDPKTYQPVPHPDPNPLDCQGHGSHVAGTAAGDGVNADGTTYTGPYNDTTPSHDFRIGPGVAPQADLYAIRVFGCAGSTDVVVPAIDWAVDNGMDVINMSLGSPFGRAGDADAVAATNAVGAGVTVVASAGNEGPSPYISGSPSSGDGVISVSAVDSTAEFPGASISVNGSSIQAINANGADLSGLPPMTVVPVMQGGALSLGCDPALFTAAGITPGGNQVAVVARGDCARVSKAIYGQAAGAAAVIMVNNADGYPPFEGAITSNPDTGEKADVTIPFLGVPLSSGPALIAAHGQTATITAAMLPNPTFKGYASFTSSGPRSGDSAIGPDVAAPGVSIRSTAVGTGNDSEVLSGTSMAAPHVAGVAALAVQAHPKWSSADIASAIISTANPDMVAGRNLVRGGVGLVNPAQVVATQVTAVGDNYKTDNGKSRQAELNFGFQESSKDFKGTKQVTLVNHGNAAVTYSVSSAKSDQSLVGASVTFNASKVTVPANGTANVTVSLSAPASAIPAKVDSGNDFGFSEISGDVVLTSGSSTLRVPYLLVPHATSNVTASTSGKATADGTSIALKNQNGALTGTADFYTWGLEDKQDVSKKLVDTGYDLRAVGVQSFPFSGTQLMVFAVSTHQRWSNAASNEYDIVIDTDGDGKADYAVFSADSGLVRTGSSDGVSEVFVENLKTGALGASGFLADAPTDSSTILLPVRASALGLTAAKGGFTYTAQARSVSGTGSDSIDGTAAYNPWAPALENGQYEEVAAGATVAVPVARDAAAFGAQKPLGVMTVVKDNANSASQALLTSVK
ncbi:S8 family serine peptidase [Microbacterium sp. ASV49]|uniref:S8 family serine peptidase n=1 Tax=Microbacterium candidum TaxID=3041922 RepID=A0ABT7MX50_9MICO|nr:S8 family serine peptidase [Microbacterium sp. ASV49]MDL9979029.1 S8 family serine peptidase [Microbacterium sp. ASV49]